MERPGRQRKISELQHNHEVEKHLKMASNKPIPTVELPMLKADTLAVGIDAPPERVFAFAHRTENLCKWNRDAFCLDLQKNHDEADRVRYHHRVDTPCGPAKMTMASNEELGVIDRYLAWGADGREVVLPSRVDWLSLWKTDLFLLKSIVEEDRATCPPAALALLCPKTTCCPQENNK
ncbi:uncharacterized protein ACA1_264060 [Acanthamoeba castellanii str. Neff]|uniref:Uncharacterized protein n=1 Tax=Acanthamoeba castellanii (strain ATCC 30010 / Neff) TaxID=1257118 RepID=L8H1X0_ACACF|nr:uncharacterized protein ACA1_264060 [Acanthamoeba castellanii str. Neff]ELR19235.1 hypothetical protein ACA1_264060 [Acanthamoeba castellanii str. Neff]